MYACVCAQHALYKYLLNLDGYTASYRLAKLMHSNSVVLKEASPHIEYFYRSLKPHVSHICIIMITLHHHQ